MTIREEVRMERGGWPTIEHWHADDPGSYQLKDAAGKILFTLETRKDNALVVRSWMDPISIEPHAANSVIIRLRP